MTCKLLWLKNSGSWQGLCIICLESEYAFNSCDGQLVKKRKEKKTREKTRERQGLTWCFGLPMSCKSRAWKIDEEEVWDRVELVRNLTRRDNE